MLTGAGIECWVAKSGSASDEIPHGDSTTTVNEEGVTTVRTTIPLSDNGLNSYHVYWRKAEGAEPQSLWCVVKWESPTGRERVESQVWMSKSNPDSQLRSTKDHHQGTGNMPRIRKILSTQSMGLVRLELQRIKGDVTSKKEGEAGVDEIEYELEDEDKLGPWCIFAFHFQCTSGSATPALKEQEDGSLLESPESQKSKKRSRPRVSLKVSNQEEAQDGQEVQDGPPPAQKRKTTRNPKPPPDGIPKTPKTLSSKPRRASTGGGKAGRRNKKDNLSDPGENFDTPDNFCPPPPFAVSQRMQSMPPPAQYNEGGVAQRMQSMPPQGEMGLPPPPGSMHPPTSYVIQFPAFHPAYGINYPPGSASTSTSLAPSANHAPGPRRTDSPLCEMPLPPMDFTYINRELQEAEALLRREQDESVELDAQIAEYTKVQTAKVMEQAVKIQNENDAKRKWLQALRDASA
ncbi:hypothetical protein K435DRAFT_960441 [Dendrothele bispora CBS 962.96]|uniref:Uncharacterized protein n=1 Tax=Dendrothele bispora (strain CBS 962.96) TaxID=1314807 RepID=A0A4S8MUT9_DENBC|nr:hypothetical protein K435DRAFT_960441 [Dendrothele bispora CBS 962.96]